jgi:hypothetical protein
MQGRYQFFYCQGHEIKTLKQLKFSFWQYQTHWICENLNRTYIRHTNLYIFLTVMTGPIRKQTKAGHIQLNLAACHRFIKLGTMVSLKNIYFFLIGGLTHGVTWNNCCKTGATQNCLKQFKVCERCFGDKCSIVTS